jgi:hypothetical protein
MGIFEPNGSDSTRLKSACQEDIELFGKKIRKLNPSLKLSKNLMGRPRQEHQVGRFLSIPEKRLARRAHLRTHGKATSKIRDLDRAHGHWKVGRDFSGSDPVPETTFHQRGTTGSSVL